MLVCPPANESPNLTGVKSHKNAWKSYVLQKWIVMSWIHLTKHLYLNHVGTDSGLTAGSFSRQVKSSLHKELDKICSYSKFPVLKTGVEKPGVQEEGYSTASTECISQISFGWIHVDGNWHYNRKTTSGDHNIILRECWSNIIALEPESVYIWSEPFLSHIH